MGDLMVSGLEELRKTISEIEYLDSSVDKRILLMKRGKFLDLFSKLADALEVNATKTPKIAYGINNLVVFSGTHRLRREGAMVDVVFPTVLSDNNFRFLVEDNGVEIFHESPFNFLYYVDFQAMVQQVTVPAINGTLDRYLDVTASDFIHLLVQRDNSLLTTLGLHSQDWLTDKKLAEFNKTYEQDQQVSKQIEKNKEETKKLLNNFKTSLFKDESKKGSDK